MAEVMDATHLDQPDGAERSVTPYDYRHLEKFYSQKQKEHGEVAMAVRRDEVEAPAVLTATNPTQAAPAAAAAANTANTVASSPPQSPKCPSQPAHLFPPSTPPYRGEPDCPRQHITESEVKRDSAIANTTTSSPPPSICISSTPLQRQQTNGRARTEVIDNPTLPSSIPPVPPIPASALRDAQAERPKTSRSVKGPTSFLRKLSREASNDALLPPPPPRKTFDPAQRPATEGGPKHTHARLNSFHGIDMDIPTDTGLEEINDEGKLKFSTRGSILMNDKGLKKMMAMSGPGNGSNVRADANENASCPETGETLAPLEREDERDGTTTTTEAGKESEQAQGTEEQTKEAPVKRTGLVSGRRKPNLQLVQASLSGGRVLSYEERCFSQKLRTMYEYGDEHAADWAAMRPSGTRSKSLTPEPSFERDATPEPASGQDDSIDNPRRRPQTGPASGQSQSYPTLRISYIAREQESAGGMEDFENIAYTDVDRYGFIKPSRTDASGSSPLSPTQRPGMQRVSTSLQLLSETPRPRRRTLRAPSSHSRRTSRSLPPSRAASRHSHHLEASPVKSPGSVYSMKSTHSSTSRLHLHAFRSRDQRLRDEAADMLTLPAGLQDAAEKPAGTPDLRHYEQHIKRREWSREEKWRKMARLVSPGTQGAGMVFDFDTSDPKLISRTWKGIPDRWRATAWHSFLSASARRRGQNISDDTLTRLFHEYQDQSSADDVQIDVDVPRTISLHIMFRRRYRGGQRLLFRVLHAISLHFPATGYVQGMAALAATLLCYYDEERAFVMLVRMWQLRGLEALYQSGFDGLMAALKEFDENWLANDADVRNKLNDLGVHGVTYGTRWYLTLFNMSIPFPAQLRVWDVFMLLGDAAAPFTAQPVDEQQQQQPAHPSVASPTSPASTTASAAANAEAEKKTLEFGGADLSVLHATSAAIIDATRVIVMESDFENVMKILTSWIPIKDEDLLMRVAKAEWKMAAKRKGGRHHGHRMHH